MTEYIERRRGRIKGSYFVSVETGLTFPDFSRCHVYRRQDQRVRKMENPIWSVRDDLLRKLLVTYLENRFFITPPTTLTLLERLQNARGAALYYAPFKKVLLKQWVQEHKRISAGGLDEKSDEEVTAFYQACPEHNGQFPMDADYARAYMRLKNLLGLEKQIQILDTDLVLTQRGHAEVIVAVVYLFYRMGWDSVEVAEHLSLKPPHIRQVLARMHNTWLSHFAESEASSKDVGGSLQRYSPDEPDSTDASAGRTLDVPPFAYLWDNL